MLLHSSADQFSPWDNIRGKGSIFLTHLPSTAGCPLCLLLAQQAASLGSFYPAVGTTEISKGKGTDRGSVPPQEILLSRC